MNRSKTYFKQFTLAMLVYPVVMGASIVLIALLAQAEVQPGWRYFAALLPVAPVFIAVRAFAGGIGALDELQRKIQLEALAFSLGGTVLCALTFGLLEMADFPRLNWAWLVPIAAGLWGVGQFLALRRYR